MLIKFGEENLAFSAAMEKYVGRWIEEDMPDTYTVKVIFHSIEDFETTLGSCFLADWAFISLAMKGCHGLQYLSKAIDTPMTVS